MDIIPEPEEISLRDIFVALMIAVMKHMLMSAFLLMAKENYHRTSRKDKNENWKYYFINYFSLYGIRCQGFDSIDGVL